MLSQHRLVRKGLRAILERQPDVEVVGDVGNEGLALLRSRELKPDVIVADLLPPRSGSDLTSTIRRLRGADPPPRILALTNHQDQEEILDLFEAGVSGLLPRETTISEFLTIDAVRMGETYFGASDSQQLTYPSARRVQRKGRKKFLDGLTARQQQVLKLIAEGYTTREMAQVLSVSPKTIESHRGHLMHKLGLHDRVDVAKFAIRQGVLRL